MIIEEQFERRNVMSQIARNRKVERVMNQTSKDLAKKAAQFELKYPEIMYQGSFYKINRQVERQVNKILAGLHKDIQANIEAGIVTNWDLANIKNNGVTQAWWKGLGLKEANIPISFQQLNLAALDIFLTRTEGGMNLSTRVWNLTNGAKDQLELYLASGISTGKSAVRMTKDVKQYLNEPNRLFRRVRREGKLVLSKAAKGYHPGAGVYRSSFKNARRLTATETNMAYRMSDHLRRKQLPFVTGVEVHLSGSHPRFDMCDDLYGEYPKGFQFGGWHPLCICYTTSILLNKKDSLQLMQTGTVAKSKYISKIPLSTKNWVKINASKIAGWKSRPYFIEDNFTKDFKLKKKIIEVK